MEEVVAGAPAPGYVVPGGMGVGGVVGSGPDGSGGGARPASVPVPVIRYVASRRCMFTVHHGQPWRSGAASPTTGHAPHAPQLMAPAGLPRPVLLASRSLGSTPPFGVAAASPATATGFASPPCLTRAASEKSVALTSTGGAGGGGGGAGGGFLYSTASPPPPPPSSVMGLIPHDAFAVATAAGPPVGKSGVYPTAFPGGYAHGVNMAALQPLANGGMVPISPVTPAGAGGGMSFGVAGGGALPSWVAYATGGPRPAEPTGPPGGPGEAFHYHHHHQPHTPPAYPATPAGARCAEGSRSREGRPAAAPAAPQQPHPPPPPPVTLVASQLTLSVPETRVRGIEGECDSPPRRTPSPPSPTRPRAPGGGSSRSIGSTSQGSDMEVTPSPHSSSEGAGACGRTLLAPEASFAGVTNPVGSLSLSASQRVPARRGAPPAPPTQQRPTPPSPPATAAVARQQSQSPRQLPAAPGRDSMASSAGGGDGCPTISVDGAYTSTHNSSPEVVIAVDGDTMSASRGARSDHARDGTRDHPAQAHASPPASPSDGFTVHSAPRSRASSVSSAPEVMLKSSVEEADLDGAEDHNTAARVTFKETSRRKQGPQLVLEDTLFNSPTRRHRGMLVGVREKVDDAEPTSMSLSASGARINRDKGLMAPISPVSVGQEAATPPPLHDDALFSDTHDSDNDSVTDSQMDDSGFEGSLRRSSENGSSRWKSCARTTMFPFLRKPRKPVDLVPVEPPRFDVFRFLSGDDDNQVKVAFAITARHMEQLCECIFNGLWFFKLELRELNTRTLLQQLAEQQFHQLRVAWQNLVGRGMWHGLAGAVSYSFNSFSAPRPPLVASTSAASRNNLLRNVSSAIAPLRRRKRSLTDPGRGGLFATPPPATPPQCGSLVNDSDDDDGGCASGSQHSDSRVDPSADEDGGDVARRLVSEVFAFKETVVGGAAGDAGEGVPAAVILTRENAVFLRTKAEETSFTGHVAAVAVKSYGSLANGKERGVEVRAQNSVLDLVPSGLIVEIQLEEDAPPVDVKRLRLDDHVIAHADFTVSLNYLIGAEPRFACFERYSHTLILDVDVLGFWHGMFGHTRRATQISVAEDVNGAGGADHRSSLASPFDLGGLCHELSQAVLIATPGHSLRPPRARGKQNSFLVRAEAETAPTRTPMAPTKDQAWTP